MIFNENFIFPWMFQKKILGEFFQKVRRKNIFVHEKKNFLGRNKNPVGRDASLRPMGKRQLKMFQRNITKSTRLQEPLQKESQEIWERYIDTKKAHR
jgi:hypothetical protein